MAPETNHHPEYDRRHHVQRWLKSLVGLRSSLRQAHSATGATLLLHPAAWRLEDATEWAFERSLEGYRVRMVSLPKGAATVVARPSAVHTNANKLKCPAYKNQFSGGRLPGGGPDAA